MIAIPNMDKPKNCAECFYALRCSAVPRWVTTDESIPRGCPLMDIVRCGECKHKIQALSTEKGATGCELISGTFYEDFFCKEGERRSDEHNTKRD